LELEGPCKNQCDQDRSQDGSRQWFVFRWSKRESHSDAHADPNGNADAHSHRNAYAGSNGDSDASANSNADAGSNSNANAHAYSKWKLGK